MHVTARDPDRTRGFQTKEKQRISFHYRDGVLHADAVSLDAIAKQVGTPAYLYSAEMLLDAARQFRAALAGVPNKQLLFAVK